MSAGTPGVNAPHTISTTGGIAAKVLYFRLLKLPSCRLCFTCGQLKRIMPIFVSTHIYKSRYIHLSCYRINMIPQSSTKHSKKTCFPLLVATPENYYTNLNNPIPHLSVIVLKEIHSLMVLNNRNRKHDCCHTLWSTVYKLNSKLINFCKLNSQKLKRDTQEHKWLNQIKIKALIGNYLKQTDSEQQWKLWWLMIVRCASSY